PAAVMDEASTLLGRHLRTSRVHYAALDPAQDQGAFHAGYTDLGLSAMDDMTDLAGTGLADIMRTLPGDALIIEDMRHATIPLPRLQDYCQRSGTSSLVVVPLTGPAGSLAGLCVHGASPRRWKAEEVELIRETADYAWSIIQKVHAENAIRQMASQLEERVARRTRQLEQARARQAFQLKMADCLRGMSDPLAMCSEASALMGRHLQASRVLFGDYNFDSKLVVFHSSYTDEAVEELSGSYPGALFGEQFFARMLDGSSWCSGDLANEPLMQDCRHTFESLQIRSIIGVPLN